MPDNGAQFPSFGLAKGSDVFGHWIKAAAAQSACPGKPLTGQVQCHDVMGFCKIRQDITPTVCGGSCTME
jgi:hypothetical protein